VSETKFEPGKFRLKNGKFWDVQKHKRQLLRQHVTTETAERPEMTQHHLQSPSSQKTLPVCRTSSTRLCESMYWVTSYEKKKSGKLLECCPIFSHV